MNALDLEKYIIRGAFPEDLPKEAYELYQYEVAEGCPTAIAKHPIHGYFVIQTTGQGPYIIWPTKNEDQ